MTRKIELISPYEGALVDLVLPTPSEGVVAFAAELPSVRLTLRQACDLEMLASGAFSPLRTFMSEADHDSVLERMRLADGTVFPIPITLSTDDISNIDRGRDIALRNAKNELLAIMKVSEIYEWERERHAEAVFGTFDTRHPVVAEMQQWGRFNLSGELTVLKLPEYRDFQDLRLTPKQTRERLALLGRPHVVAFQTRNPIHFAHEVMTQRAIAMIDGTLLMHPVVGMTKEGDIDYFTRVRTYKEVCRLSYPGDRVLLALLPLAMRMAGPREAVWHAIIRRNFGASHFIVGRDHASPGLDSNSKPFYDSTVAQTLTKELSAETGVTIIPFQELAYLPEEQRYEEIDKIAPGSKVFSLSGTSVREDFLRKGQQFPEWFTRKEVAQILQESYPPRHRQGVCMWFTGLSGSGKSTTAEIVTALLLEEGRRATLLDGDVVRTHLSKGLGFSKEDRNINVNRIGFVASEVVRHGGIAVCSAVSPHRESRDQVRVMFAHEQFVEVFVDAPLEVCESRDAKGMYAKARKGEIKGFTGIDDVYESPVSPEIILDAVNRTARENAQAVIEYLRAKGFVTNSLPRAKKD